jgi:hypothetical protein
MPKRQMGAAVGVVTQSKCVIAGSFLDARSASDPLAMHMIVAITRRAQILIPAISGFFRTWSALAERICGIQLKYVC